MREKYKVSLVKMDLEMSVLSYQHVRSKPKNNKPTGQTETQMCNSSLVQMAEWSKKS